MPKLRKVVNGMRTQALSIASPAFYYSKLLQRLNEWESVMHLRPGVSNSQLPEY